ncbi:MAG: sulfotransferase domain-containing protein [Flavobacteriaceae bacterium]|nr:sulfotransferase domain-containing protein [Flavobacteriaceae bacterium]MCB9299006.1 sulfotransferase domain-containing protein [Lewinellaceae bacterium]
MKFLLKRIRHQIRLLNKQLSAYWTAIVNPEHKPQKFIILAQGRTGSSLLKEVLNSHPMIHCDDEMLNKAYNFSNGNVFFPSLFLEGLSLKHPHEVYGCKIKPNHLKQQTRIRDEKAFILHFIQKGWKIIYLYRSNILHHALSNIVAEQRRSYHLRKGESNNVTSLKVDIKRLEAGMRSRMQQLEDEERFLKDISYLELNYEKDLLTNPQVGADKAFTFLGLPSVTVHTNLVKVVNTNLEEFLENYGEVELALKDTVFEKYLRETS